MAFEFDPQFLKTPTGWDTGKVHKPMAIDLDIHRLIELYKTQGKEAAQKEFDRICLKRRLKSYEAVMFRQKFHQAFQEV